MADVTRVIRIVADAGQYKRELGQLVVATKKAADETARTARSLERMESAGRSVGKAFKIIAAAAAALKLVSVIKQAADEMGELQKSAQRAGVSVEVLAGFNYAAELAGASAQTMGNGLRALNKNLAEMDTATTKNAKALRALGVVSTDTADQALAKIADKFQEMPDGANKTALAMAALGKGGAQLIPLLNGGAEGLKAMAEEADRFGLVMSEKATREAEEFGDNIDRMGKAAKGAGIQLTSGMLPSLVLISNELVASIGNVKEFHDVGNQLGEMLVSLAIAALHTARSVGTFRKTLGAAGASAALALSGELDAARQVWTEFSGDIKADVLETEEKIESLRAKFRDLKTNGPTAPGDREPPKTDDIGTGWTDTKGGQGDGVPKRKKLPNWAADALAEAEAYFDELQKIADAFEDMSREAEDLKKIAIAWNDGAEAGEAMERTLEAQNRLREWQKQNPLASDAEVERFRELLKMQDEWRQKGEEAKQKFADDQERAKQAAEQMSDVFVDWATGIIDAQGALKGFVAILLDFLAKKYVVDFLANMLGGGPTEQAKGAAYSGGVKQFARGGVVGSPTLFGIRGGLGLMGEAGPEGILPLRRDRSGNLGVIASQKPELKVVVNNHAGVDVTTSAAPDGGLTLDIVRRAISADIQRGGSSVARSIERTYGVGRGR